MINKNFIKFLTTSLSLLAINSSICYCMEKLTKSGSQQHMINNFNQNVSNTSSIYSVAENQIDFAEFKSIIKSFANAYNNEEIVNKQKEIVKLLPKILKELMGNNTNNYYSCTAYDDLVECVSRWTDGAYFFDCDLECKKFLEQ